MGTLGETIEEVLSVASLLGIIAALAITIIILFK